MFSSIRCYLRRHHLALLALFVALGGTSYAAVNLPNNSVGSGEIKKNAVKAPEIAKNAVKAAEVARGAIGSSEARDGSLNCADLAPAACQGDGPGNVTVRSITQTIPLSCIPDGLGGQTCFGPSAPVSVTAQCNAGERATGGGWEGSTQSDGGDFSAARIDNADRPQPPTGNPTGWTARATGSGGSSDATPPPNPPFTVYAVCAS